MYLFPTGTTKKLCGFVQNFSAKPAKQPAQKRDERAKITVETRLKENADAIRRIFSFQKHVGKCMDQERSSEGGLML